MSARVISPVIVKKWFLVGTLITLVVVTYSCPRYVFLAKFSHYDNWWRGARRNFHLSGEPRSHGFSAFQNEVKVRGAYPNTWLPEILKQECYSLQTALILTNLFIKYSEKSVGENWRLLGGSNPEGRILAGYYGSNANILFTFQAMKNLSAYPTNVL